MEIEREERNGSGYQEKQEFITGIYYEYERLMFATARRYIDGRTEQEDVVQESLKKLIEKQERLAGLAQAAQAGYVATTVRNTAISILREKTKGKDKILSLDALGEDALRRYMIPHQRGGDDQAGDGSATERGTGAHGASGACPFGGEIHPGSE